MFERSTRKLLLLLVTFCVTLVGAATVLGSSEPTWLAPCAVSVAHLNRADEWSSGIMQTETDSGQEGRATAPFLAAQPASHHHIPQWQVIGAATPRLLSPAMLTMLLGLALICAVRGRGMSVTPAFCARPARPQPLPPLLPCCPLRRTRNDGTCANVAKQRDVSTRSAIMRIPLPGVARTVGPRARQSAAQPHSIQDVTLKLERYDCIPSIDNVPMRMSRGPPRPPPR